MSVLTLDRVSFGYAAGRPTLSDVSLRFEAGASVGIVGESGSGKTTILRLLLGLIEPVTGEVARDGVRLNIRDRALMRRYRRAVQPVFQDPWSSLDPRQRVFDIVAEPLRSLRIEGDRNAAVRAALASVGLGDEDMLRRYPHEFSGGQRQRIAIARAIAPRPEFVLADEAVSALDLTTRVRIVELFRQLAREVTLVFVSHDLGVVAELCRDIVVLEQGQVVESGATRDILSNPQHPYTQRLLASVPRMPVKERQADNERTDIS